MCESENCTLEEDSYCFEMGPALAAFEAEAKLFLTDVTCVSGVKFTS
jgi:hypothetical protein